ncbi:2TM domain protein [uncultured archaeon]|nr:2TM domain protein [uncultured archaeon]
MVSDEELRRRAEKRAEEKIGFYTHFGIYIIVNLLIFLIWFFTSGPGSFPWFIFPLFGWGIGIFAHFISVYKVTDLRERMTEEEYDKLKRENK